MIIESIEKLANCTNLSEEESAETMREIMSGQATPSQISAFLTALRMKCETIEEIAAFARVMRENCRVINPRVNGRLIDTCGTGGDKIKTFNVSTAAAFVSAGSGISVAKHGNRSVTSQCGSADVLERMGVNLKAEPNIIESAIEQVGIGFMFAPVFHPAMKYAVAPRREIGLRTVFNILGPLTNPATADAQLLGVYDCNLTNLLAEVLKRLGVKEAMIVHGIGGLDEISTFGETIISRLKNGTISTENMKPKDLGVKKTKVELVCGNGIERNVEIFYKILNGQLDRDDPRLEIVLVNSAATLIMSGKVDNFSEGLEDAYLSVKSGLAYKKLRHLVIATEGDLSKLEEMETNYD